MKKKLKKEIIEWTAIIAVLLVVINTGIGSKVAAYVQRGVLYTGLAKPSVLEESEYKTADYNFRLRNESGELVNFSQFEGKTVFLNFWATWCPPCIAEMPDINDLHASLANNDQVIFIMISVDKNRQKALQFKEEESLDLPVYFMESGLPEAYDAHAIPTTYVISPEGKIVAERHGIAQYNSKDFRNFLTSL